MTRISSSAQIIPQRYSASVESGSLPGLRSPLHQAGMSSAEEKAELKQQLAEVQNPRLIRTRGISDFGVRETLRYASSVRVRNVHRYV